MKVTGVTTTVLSIPNSEPYYYSQGCSLGTNSVLVEVQTDEGITGIGEACGDRSCEAVVGVVRAAARALEGQDPFDIERFLYRRLNPFRSTSPSNRFTGPISTAWRASARRCRFLLPSIRGVSPNMRRWR